jgi:hypothetical protein
MKRTLLKTFTMLWLLGMYIILVFTFLQAFQSPDKSVRVMIDYHSEANIELLMLSSALVVTVIGSYLIFSDISRHYSQRVARRYRLY